MKVVINYNLIKSVNSIGNVIKEQDHKVKYFSYHNWEIIKNLLILSMQITHVRGTIKHYKLVEQMRSWKVFKHKPNIS